MYSYRCEREKDPHTEKTATTPQNTVRRPKMNTTDYATITTAAHKITLYGQPADYTLELHLAVEDLATGTVATTETTEDWPAVEAALPRRQWPAPIYAGKRFETRENVPTEFTNAIQTAIEDEVTALIGAYGADGEQERISAVRITRSEGITLTRDGVEIALRDYASLLEDMEG